MLNLINDFNFRNKQIRTETSEVDLYFNIGPEFIKEHPIQGNLAIFECKNQKETINVKDMSHLICEFFERKCKFGGFVTTSFFSKNAKRRAQNFFKSNDFFIILLDGNDLKKICNGNKTILELMIEKINHTIFFSENKNA